MGTVIAALVAALIALFIGGLAVYFYLRGKTPAVPVITPVDTDRLLAEAQAQQKEVILAAKEEAHSIRTAAEQDARERRAEVQRMERRVQQKEENLDRRIEGLEKRERQVTQREEEIEARRGEIDELIAEQRRELERISGLTEEEAAQRFLQSVEVEMREQATAWSARSRCRPKRRPTNGRAASLPHAIQRWASDQVSESSVSVVPLPSEEMKGRIIGREGRNIRALEMATGVDLIIDDTPEAVILSGFDPVRREIARQALNEAHSGRSYPSGAHRRDGREGTCRGRHHHQGRGRAGGV